MSQITDHGDWLSVDEAARVLVVSSTVIVEQIASGQIEVREHGPGGAAQVWVQHDQSGVAITDTQRPDQEGCLWKHYVREDEQTNKAPTDEDIGGDADEPDANPSDPHLPSTAAEVIDACAVQSHMTTYPEDQFEEPETEPCDEAATGTEPQRG